MTPGIDALAPADAGPDLSGPLDAWLVEGGDDRIAIDPKTGVNRYGCGLAPDIGLTAFGSSTASTISPLGRQAAEARRAEFEAFGSTEAAWIAGSAALKARLADLCGLPADAPGRILLSPSGTDVCEVAARLARGTGEPLPVILPDPRETGRGVPGALASAGEVVSIVLREADGRTRSPEAVDADVERSCEDAIAASGRALLVLLDVSKTGLIAPSPACAERLSARWGERLVVLVDACQFRLGPESVRQYLDRGWMVAVTGSKFLGGPAFSGALLLPPGLDVDPAAFERQSLGLLLRWEAAVAELALLRELPEPAVTALIERFGAAVEAALDASPAFERLPAADLTRFGGGWDTRPTIFSFLLLKDGRPLDTEATTALFARLRDARLGQPVPVGKRDGRPVSVLRLALGARQINAALRDPRGPQRLIDRALAALAATAEQIG